jgi:hypothetical protein
MSEPTSIALLTTLATVLLAVVGFITAGGVRLNRRLQRLEHRDRLSWLYIRILINHAYVHNATPLPDPPAGWLDDPGE